MTALTRVPAFQVGRARRGLENVDVRQLLAITRKWIPLLVAGMVAAAVVGFGISSLQAKTFESRTTLIVGQSLSSSSPDYTGLLASEQLATTYASIAATRSQLQGVIAQLNLATTPDELSRRVDASAVSGSSLITITVQDSIPDRAAAIANALADALIKEMSPSAGLAKDFHTSVTDTLTATQDQISSTNERVQELLSTASRTAAQDAELATLQAQLVTLRSAYVSLLGLATSTGATNTVAVVDPAVAAADPIGPRTLLNTLVAAILGLLAAAGIAAIAEVRNDRVGEIEQIEREARAPLLSSIGLLKLPGDWGAYPLVTVIAPRSGAAEAYSRLRANLEFASVDHPMHSLLVASAQPSEGKTLTAANTAAAWAQTGRRVLLVDGDLRMPSVHTVFGTRNDHGLTTALVAESVPLDRLIAETGQPNLWVLPSGPLPPNPAELLASRRMRALLETLRSLYDLVVIDSSPLSAVADAAIVGALVGATVLVVDSERGKRRSLIRARDQLALAGANVIGVVVNRAPGGRGLDEPGPYGGYLRRATQPAAVSPAGRAQAPTSDPTPAWATPQAGESAATSQSGQSG